MAKIEQKREARCLVRPEIQSQGGTLGKKDACKEIWRSVLSFAFLSPCENFSKSRFLGFTGMGEGSGGQIYWFPLLPT